MKAVIFLLFCAIVSETTAWTCNDYMCSGIACGQVKTCDSGSFQCQTSEVTFAGQVMTTYSCPTNTCTPLATNMSTMGMGPAHTTCCSGNQCNDGTSPTLEPNLAYCYSASCMGKGCLPLLINHIDSNNLQTFCAASEEGCQTTTTYTYSTDPVLGLLETAAENTGCATEACKPIYQNIEGIQVGMHCCKDRMCNNGGEMTLAADKEYCYAYTCTHPDPAACSMKDAVSKKVMAYCEKPAEGCFYTAVFTGNTTVIAAGCVGEQYSMAQCIPYSFSSDGTTTKIQCCSSDRCNSGDEDIGYTVDIDPNKDYCHVYTCMSSNCLSMSQAIEQNKTGVCEKPDKGCYVSIVSNSGLNMITSGCYVNKPELGADCTPRLLMEGGNQSSFTCCNSDRCNDDTLVQDSEDENKDYCHVYSCTETTSVPCMSLSEAIRKGKTLKCEKPEKGCFAMKVEGTSISAGCVAEAYHFAQCSTAAPNPNTEVVCCSENQCNNGFTSASFPAFHRGSSIALIAILWILKQVLVA